jgi:predicted transcriptional regulator
LDILDRLAEKGIDEKTLMKWLIIKEIFRIDLDELADDLKKYSSVKVAASRLEERRARLESEELVMRHRLLALQERGQPVASATRVTKPIDDAAIPRIRVRRTGKELDMVPLIKAAEGEMASVDQDVLDKTIADLIDLIREVLEPRGFTKTLLDHAKLSLEHDKKTAQRHI